MCLQRCSSLLEASHALKGAAALQAGVPLRRVQSKHCTLALLQTMNKSHILLPTH